MWIAVLLVVAACGGEPVGRLCDLGEVTPQPSEVVIASGSLDCVTRTCLRYPPATSGLCTAVCETDDDCEGVPESPCVTGFTCAVAVQTGPFANQRFCICADYTRMSPTGPLP